MALAQALSFLAGVWLCPSPSAGIFLPSRVETPRWLSQQRTLGSIHLRRHRNYSFPDPFLLELSQLYSKIDFIHLDECKHWKNSSFYKGENKANLNFFLTAILKDAGQENEWKKMQFRLPKALADSCLIPELSCQFKPFPWQGFNSFHPSWELEKVRERTLPLCTRRLDCLSRKASVLEALAGNSGMGRARYPNRDGHSAPADTSHHIRCNPHQPSASARHPQDPVQPPRLTRPHIIPSVSDCIQCTSLGNVGFTPLISWKCFPWCGKRSFALGSCGFWSPVLYLVKEACLHLKD